MAIYQRLSKRGKTSIIKKKHTSHLMIEPLEPRRLLSVILPQQIPNEAPLVDESGLWVTIGEDNASTLSYTDYDNTDVIVKLKGGAAQIHLAGDNLGEKSSTKSITVDGRAEIDEIILSDIDGKSKMSFTAKGGADNLAQVGKISGSGTLGKLSGKTINLVGEGIDMEGGAINSIQLHDIVNGADILMKGTGATKGVSMQLNEIGPECDIDLQSGLKSLKAVSWTSGSFSAPWAQSFQIIGNKEIHNPAIFDVQMDLTGEGVPVGKPILGKAKIFGNCSNSIHIDGDVQSITLGSLTGDLDINGDVKNIKLNDDLMLAPTAATNGQLKINGSTKIKSGGETFNLSSGAVLYASTEGSYSLEDLLLYDRVGASWDYNLKVKGDGMFLGSGAANSTVRVYHDGFNRYRVEEFAQVKSTYWDDDEYYETQQQAWTWAKNSSGFFLNEIESEIDIAELYFSFYALQAAPQHLAMNDTFTDTSSADGYLDIGWGWSSISIDLEGTAEINTTLLGHETVTVPAGTFLAARLNLDLSYEFTGELSGPEKDYQVKVKQDNQFSYWAVPGMGIVKSIEKGTASVSIPGEGCAKASATVTRTLSGF